MATWLAKAYLESYNVAHPHSITSTLYRFFPNPQSERNIDDYAKQTRIHAGGGCAGQDFEKLGNFCLILR
jgi:hypothetical protein